MIGQLMTTFPYMIRRSSYYMTQRKLTAFFDEHCTRMDSGYVIKPMSVKTFSAEVSDDILSIVLSQVFSGRGTGMGAPISTPRINEACEVLYH
jgi:hypothetical protein